MFNNLSPQEQLQRYEFVTAKAKKLGKLLGGFSAALLALIGVIAIFSGNATVGALVSIILCSIAVYFVNYHIGKCYPWAYYWLLTKFEEPIPLLGALFFGFYIGLALRFKYHGFKKKIQTQY